MGRQTRDEKHAILTAAGWTSSGDAPRMRWTPPTGGPDSALENAWRKHRTLQEAADHVLAEIKRLGGDAGLIAVSRSGEIAMPYNSDGMKRAAVATNLPLVATTFD